MSGAGRPRSAPVTAQVRAPWTWRSASRKAEKSFGFPPRAARSTVCFGMECKQALIASAMATLGLFVLFTMPPALAFTLSALVAAGTGLAARFTPEEA